MNHATHSGVGGLLVVALVGCGDPGSTEDGPTTLTVTTSDSGSSSTRSATAGPVDTSASAGITSAADGSSSDDDPSTQDTGDPTCPPLPDPAPAWLEAMQADVVARLSGAAELTPDVTLPERSTLANRIATRDYLVEQWSAIGLEGLTHGYSETGTNVFATLAATEKTDRTLVVGAHFDTVPGSPGANDNATGVAMVLALGRWLQDLPCRDANVILVLFDEEEIGLVGSFAFADWLTRQPLDVVAVHTIDQMGWDSDGDRGIELERADEGLFELYDDAEALAPFSTPLTPTNTGFTDHVSFRKFGFDAVGVTEQFVSGDTTPHYHLPSDTFDTIDLGYLAQSSALLHLTIGRSLTADP